MSSRSRSGRCAKQRSPSTALRDRETGEAVPSRQRTGSLQRRPLAATMRTPSVARSNRAAPKTRAVPAAGISKRTAAKRRALRARLPYLRPVPDPTAPLTAETRCTPPQPSRRSLSSGYVSRETTLALKSSCSTIPEALQNLKRICNGVRETEKDAAVLVVTLHGGSGARDRRSCRPAASSTYIEPSEEAAMAIQSICAVQNILFSSLQMGSASNVFGPSSPRLDLMDGPTRHARSKSWNPPNGTPLLTSGSCRLLSKKDRLKAWVLFLHKHTHAFPLIVNACRSPLAVRELHVMSVVLTFLYNVLRHLPPEKQGKAVVLCEKLGVIRVCINVLQDAKRRANHGDPADIAAFRACEAAAMIFTLFSTYNGKLWAVFRLSQSLENTFLCAAATFRALESEFTAFQTSLRVNPELNLVSAAVREYTNTHSRKETLKALQQFQARSQWSCTAFSHFCFTLFAFTSNASAAAEVGARAVELCATAIAMDTIFLTQVVPLLLASVSYNATEDTLHPDVGSLAPIDSGHWAPSWVMRFLRRVEFMLVWCVALMQRLANFDKVRFTATEVALRSHVPHGLVFYLRPPPRQILLLSPRRECVHVVLLLLGAFLKTNRAGTLEDIQDLDGLKGVVQCVQAQPEKSSQQWHHFYLQLCTMYGCTALPMWPGQSACYIDERIPTSPISAVEAAPTRSTPESTTDPGAGYSPSQQLSPSAATESSLKTTEQSLSAVDGVSETVRGDFEKSLLAVDLRPGAFSPELRGGDVEPLSALAEFHKKQLPRAFTDTPPPTTANSWQGTASRIPTAAADAHLSVPLKPISEDDQIRVLRHHITRLTNHEEAACDGSARPHQHKIVFERISSAPSSVAADAIKGMQNTTDGIQFFSHYESGNLQRVVEVSDAEFDLVLAWDTATNSYTQWFNFGVRRYVAGKRYRFNILNMEKLGSTFNDGQKPLLLYVPNGYTSGKADVPHPQWTRAGTDIFYFGNAYLRPPRAHYFGKGGDAPVASPASTFSPPTAQIRSMAAAAPPLIAKKRVPVPPSTAQSAPQPPPVPQPAPPSGGSVAPTAGEAGTSDQRCYFTLSFSITMPSEAAGTVYLANCFPFTYMELREHVAWLEAQASANPKRSLMVQSLCTTPGGVDVPLLTVTALRSRNTGEMYSCEEVQKRPIVLFVARVHPGESNASWVMQGLLDSLLSPQTAAAEETASVLCEHFVIKVVPMLNIDGVVMGNHRCSFYGVDLNRDYSDPKAERNPTLYALKQLLRYWRDEEHRQTVMFADFHGHSRAKNFLVYGCTKSTIRSVAARKSHKVNSEGNEGKVCRPCGLSSNALPGSEKVVASLLSLLFPSFSLPLSSFAVTKDKKGSARVVLYDEFGVRMSYGFEATMVGGFVKVPNLLQSNSELEALDEATSASIHSTLREEVHYGPTVFRAMGEAFLRALSLLRQQWTELLANAADSASVDRKGSLPDEAEESMLQVSWAMTAAAGGGREPPKALFSPVSREGGAVPRVGPYAVATRVQRRTGSPSSVPIPSPMVESMSALPYVPAAGQLEALNYLFLANLPLGAGVAEDVEEDRADEEEDSGVESDTFAPCENEEGDFDDDALSTAMEGVRRRSKQAVTTEPALTFGGGGRSASSSSAGSGSDDQDWCNAPSFGGSGADDLADDRSSISSVDEEIPTNLFM